MTSPFEQRLPTRNEQVRRALYRGAIYLLPATDASLELTDMVWNEVEQELGGEGPARLAQFRLSDAEYFARVGRLRKKIYTNDAFHAVVARLFDSLGFAREQHAFDPARLRVIAHGGHENPAARAIYHGHRDTWYGNPQSMITWWTPLHDVEESETFEFFPDEFDRPVANDSQVFDFDEWVHDGQERRIGWQNRETGRVEKYPRLKEPPRGRRVPVACQRSEILLFAGQHLHQTRLQNTGKTRFSLDFRTVHVTDHETGACAVNVDNRSTGCSLRQFVRPNQASTL